MQAVAMIGLGHMGTPIAHSLIRAGHDVRVFNRTPSKTTLLEGYGATAADSPAAAVAGLAVVVTSLLDDDSMLNMLRREDGLLASMERDSVHVCTTTISPGCAVEMGRLHRDAGQRFVAAPVIGRPPAAEAGTLIVLAATDGDDRDLADVFDILEAISSRIIRPGGGAASAYTMKLAINFLIISTIEMFGELFALTEKGGIDSETMSDLVGQMLNHPAISEYLNRVSERRFDDAGFEATTGLKDVNLMLQHAGELGVPLPYANLIRDRLLTAVAEGNSKMDWSIIAQIARQQTGL